MYLKRLWLHNKVLCGLLLLFATFQIINNIRQDVAFSPVYTYGMYSQVIKPQKKYIVPEISVNGNLLETKNFTPQQWDKIILPVLLFSKQEAWNRFEFDSYIRRLLQIEDSSFYINKLSKAQFDEWYKKYLSEIIHLDISNLVITFNEFDFNNRELRRLRTLETTTIQWPRVCDDISSLNIQLFFMHWWSTNGWMECSCINFTHLFSIQGTMW